MKKLGLFSKDTNFDFVKYRKISILFSIILLIASFIYLSLHGFNLGVDFRGGTVLVIKPHAPHVLENQNSIKVHARELTQLQPLVQEISNNTLVQVTLSGNTAQKISSEGVNPIHMVVKAVSPYGEVIKTDFVGPNVSRALMKGSAISVLLALLGIFLYVWARFDSRYAAIAIATLIHDVILGLTALTLLGYEVNVSTIAAALTIIGYSINDTIITFHQVKENSIRYPHLEDAPMLNQSLNDVISRTVSTSLTVILVLVSVYLFGGSSLTSFSFTLLVGVIFGTYSSIFLCVPALMYVKNYRSVSRKYKVVR